MCAELYECALSFMVDITPVSSPIFIQTSKMLGRIGAEMTHLRKGQSSRATSAAFDTEEEEEEEEDSIRGQVSVHIQSVKQLPASDEDSGSDPYCVVKLSGHPDRQTKMFENVSDAQFDDKFLYFVDDIKSTGKIFTTLHCEECPRF
jgi:hypothetical protein